MSDGGQRERQVSNSPGVPVGPGPLGDEAEASEPLVPGSLSEAELEALLFVAERPLSRRELATLTGVDRATVDERLGDLEVSLVGRGIRLVVDGERVVLATAPETGPLIARYIGADATRLSQASLETLAIVAYRQPVTRAAVERIRGVDSDYTIRSLLHRRLIVELGRSETPGRPYLYGTSIDFLERFGLTSLEQLPALDVDVAARLAEEGADVAPILGVAALAGPPANETPTGGTPPDEAPGTDRPPSRGPSTADAPTIEDG